MNEHQQRLFERAGTVAKLAIVVLLLLLGAAAAWLLMWFTTAPYTSPFPPE